jgi:hypothetical protein
MKTPVALNRRGLFAAAGVALLEMKLFPVTAKAKDKECVHDQHCLDGRVCVDGQCVGTVPCTLDSDCTSPAVCRNAICVTITVDSGGVTLVQPVTINLLRRKRRRRKSRRRKH